MKHLKNHEKEELKRKAFQLHEDGLSYQDIATKFGIGKTTVYNWITYDYPKYDVRSVVGTSSSEHPNGTSAPGELNEIRKDLEEEYGSNKDVATLADLRKAQMAHDLEYEKLIHDQSMEEQKLNSDRLKEELDKTEIKLKKEAQKAVQLSQANSELASTTKILQQENNDLHELVGELTNEEETIVKNEQIELDEKLKDEVTAIITEFFELEAESIISDDVNEMLDNNEKITKKLKKWCKKESVSKNDCLELSEMDGMYNSLIDMLDEFEIQEEDELVFELNSDFEIELKEKYPDLVIQPSVDDDAKIDLNEDLQEEYTDRIAEYLNLEDKETTVDDIDSILDSTETTIENIGQWCNEQELNESNSEELSTLNTIIEILNDILLDFESSDEEELPITFDSDFDIELKENHPDLVVKPAIEETTPKKRRRRRPQYQ